jgi:catechol 2,3-dioxygenase-like lactoylglutathione lyase family enzyme
MPVFGLHHYNLRAPQPLLDKLCRFYCEVVGLSQGYRPPFRSFGYWLYAGEVPVLHLSEARPDEIRNVDSPSTFDHAAFACRDLAATLEKLQRAGVTYTVDIVPDSKLKQVFFSDPAGNGVELNFAEEE